MYKPYMISYFLNKYAKDHVKSTVIKFNNHIRASLKDAVEEGLIPFDPTRKAVIKGKDLIITIPYSSVNCKKIIKVELQRKIGNSLTNIFSLSKD
ncbi:hypothetical protein EfmAA96_08190 [Enterococcus faecium]|nr:hypothetical protein EfmAA96_08190 [Enterococcus faecium]